MTSVVRREDVSSRSLFGTFFRSRYFFLICFFEVFTWGLLSDRMAFATSDPSLVWYTLKTAHFRITYHSGEKEIAERVANIAETIYRPMGEVLGHLPSEPTEVILTDFSDDANGSATAFPMNTIRLYASAPDDLSPLGDHDDWYLALFTHEFTHILHIDHISGIPSLVNKLLGKTLAPNQNQPRWILEGLAVLEESKHTSGGRLRSSVWDMYMRTDVLGDHIATLDQMSHFIRRWPQGNLWYLYGSYFLKWITDQYGDESMRKLARDYGNEIIPWGMNRSLRRSIGFTFEELYPRWISEMKSHYKRQRDEVVARGLREGTQISFSGQIARTPRWIPKGSFAGKEGNLLVFQDDGHKTPGFYAYKIAAALESDGVNHVHDASKKYGYHDPSSPEFLIRAQGNASLSFDSDGSVYFSHHAFFRNQFVYHDLYHMAAGITDTSGLSGERIRLTEGMRAIEPDVVTFPSGKRKITFIKNSGGSRSLQVADLDEQGVHGIKPLLPHERFDQAFTPRFSHDGKHLVYSYWRKGGYRDIRYVNLDDLSYENISSDRAIDGGCTFSPDDKFVFFHSDRTGISNIYRWNTETKLLEQITNVLTGAFSPEVSPDGKHVAYIGYTTAGFDVFVMDLNPSLFLAALPYKDTRPSLQPVSELRPGSTSNVSSYNPLLTLVPRRYKLETRQGNYGQSFVISVAGNDLAELHSFSASLNVETEKPTLQGNISYTYGRLPFDMTLSLSRSIRPNYEFRIGDFNPGVMQVDVQADASVGFSKRKIFEGQNMNFGYSFGHTGAEFVYPEQHLDPYVTPIRFRRGMVARVHAHWDYSNAQGFLHGVSSEKGFSVGLDGSLAHEILGSEYSGYAIHANYTHYFPMPWFQHHALALHAGLGMSGGSYTGQGTFYVGGFSDISLIDTVRDILIQGSASLRGYPVAVTYGSYVTVFNAEYRFPIFNLDRGISTLPIFLNRLSGNLFADYGAAFDSLRDSHFKLGTGVELWTDWILAYTTNFTFRFGYAKGWASGGLDKFYVVAAVPY